MSRRRKSTLSKTGIFTPKWVTHATAKNCSYRLRVSQSKRRRHLLDCQIDTSEIVGTPAGWHERRDSIACQTEKIGRGVAAALCVPRHDRTSNELNRNGKWPADSTAYIACVGRRRRGQLGRRRDSGEDDISTSSIGRREDDEIESSRVESSRSPTSRRRAIDRWRHLP